MSDTIDIPTTEQTTEYLFDVDALVSEHDLLLKKEAEDRALANTIEFPDTVAFKAKLMEWASNGFPRGHPVFSVTLSPPAVCSDGVTRNDFVEYAEFLCGTTILEMTTRFSSKLKGITIEYVTNETTMTFLAYRDA